MDFGLSSEQQMLKDAVRRCLAENCPLDHVRACADAGTAVSEPAAAALHAIGLSGLMVPEAHGGLGMTLLDAAVVAEELGRAVAPVPWRVPAAERALAGKTIDEAVAAQVAAAAVAGAKPLSGNAYKIQIARTAVKRALLKAAGVAVA